MYNQTLSERAIMQTELVDWLLEPNNPAVRHATLATLLGKSPDDPQVRKARKAMMQSDPIRTILARQHSDGYWDKPAGFYSRKHRGTVWQVIFLAQLGADPADDGIRKGCEFLFARSQNEDNGGFAFSSNRQQSGGGMNCAPCLTANMVRSLRYFGYADDARWHRAVHWLIREQHDDGGWGCKGHSCHGCFQASIKALLALTDLPPAERGKPMQRAIDRAAAFFLQHRLFRRDHHGFDVAKPGHLKLRFPMGWHTDALDMLDGVTAAGVTDDRRLADALAVVLSKQDADGRWPLEETFPVSGSGAMLCEIEKKGRPSKWITLRALRVLQRIGPANVAKLTAMGGAADDGTSQPPTARKRRSAPKRSIA